MSRPCPLLRAERASNNWQRRNISCSVLPESQRDSSCGVSVLSTLAAASGALVPLHLTRGRPSSNPPFLCEPQFLHLQGRDKKPVAASPTGKYRDETGRCGKCPPENVDKRKGTGCLGIRVAKGLTHRGVPHRSPLPYLSGIETHRQLGERHRVGSHTWMQTLPLQFRCVPVDRSPASPSLHFLLYKPGTHAVLTGSLKD